MSVDLSKNRRDTHICFGGNIDITSKQNDVGTFDYEDYTELNSSFGKVTGIGQIGYTLHVIQENKVTSFYIERSVLQLSDGSAQIGLSEKILNNKEVSDFDYGTLHEDSVIQRNTHLLFFDGTRGSFTRVAKNGAFEISNYGVNGIAKALAQIARTAVSFNIMGSYDEINDIYIWFWYYVIGTTTYTGGVSFRDGENSWRGSFDFTKSGEPIEWITAYQNRIITFLNGDAWLHEEDSADGKEYNNWYTEDKESRITLVHAQHPYINKVLRTITEVAEDEWLPSINGDITTGSMTSMILISKKVEDRYLLTFKRNTSTKISGTTLEKLNLGEVLRGNTATITLRAESNTRNRLKFVTIVSTPSEPV
jgi:hypothetical protein